MKMVFEQCCVIYLLATTISLPQVLGKESQQESTVMLDVYHVHGSKSPLSSNQSISYLDVLARDENRAKALANRITGKKPGKSAISNTTVGLLGPKSANVPVSPGASIGTGNYIVKVGFGSPAKYFAVVLDTGSTFSWIQCKPCVDCHIQVDPLFEPSASKSYKSLSCKTPRCSVLKNVAPNNPPCESNTDKCLYKVIYGDLSYSIGYLSQDVLSLKPSESLPNFIFGCASKNEGLFGQSSGLIGLSRKELSMFYQLAPRYGYAFSYCLPRVGRGFLSLGNLSLTASAFKFTPMLTPLPGASLYYLQISTIKIAGKPLGVSVSAYSVHTIIDSGAVITRLPDSVYASLKRAFSQVMSRKYSTAPSSAKLFDTCFKGSSKSMTVPPFQLIFQGGAELNLEAANALYDIDNGITCLAFAPISSIAAGLNIAIIGNHQHRTFTVAYDVANSRIGFAPRGCH